MKSKPVPSDSSEIRISEQLGIVGAVRFNSSPLHGRGVPSLKGLSGSAERNRRRYLQRGLWCSTCPPINAL